jgi:hypothetical protein
VGFLHCVHRMFGPVVLVATGLSSVHAERPTMVCLAVPRFGFQPTICLARPLLHHALDCYQRGDYIGAGVRLRESATRFLVAAVEWYAVDVSKRTKRSKHPRPVELAKALHRAQRLDEWGLTAILEMLDVGNAAAHCQPFCPKALRGAIAFLFCYLDDEPFSAMRERQPAVETTFENGNYEADDCDDDRSEGDEWKGGAT